MTVRSLDHIQLAMLPGREADARAFYEGILGIPEIAKSAQLAARDGCWFGRGPLKVHLGVERDFRPARFAHPAFVVEGIGELARKIEEAGYRVVDDGPAGGYKRVYAEDPFGNRIELMEPLDPAG
ncbi:MAG TPA: VOC family protein [Candidatus Udaeobacter sp.]|nr:VOC family protein [Candidatus Udaeobacter sp.]